jgi:chaperonin GroEL (HSP60 family)
VSEDLGHKLEKVELAQLGQVKKVTVTKDDTILLHGAGERRAESESAQMEGVRSSTTTRKSCWCLPRLAPHDTPSRTNVHARLTNCLPR